jgi:glycine/D-amino acid oxidase-like deaminating enzyme
MTIAVLGAGLQGVLCALELAELGHHVVIFDAASGALQKASLHNEGKIHLGYVYAKDFTNRSANLMAEGASRFSELLDRWWPEANMAATASDPFDYLVMPDSLEPADWIAGRYRQIDAALAQHLSRPGRSYLGQKDVAPASRLDRETAEQRYDGRHVAAVFRTAERAIDLQRMSEVLRDALTHHPRVECRWRTRIMAVQARADGTYGVMIDGNATEGPFDHVINALWSDRLRVDETIGIKVRRPYLFRQKVANRILLPQSPQGFRSATMVIGGFGDFVALPSGSCYLSWYPSGCFRRTTDISPPADWDHTPASLLTGIFEESAAALSLRIRGLDRLVEQAVGRTSVPAVIFCWGQTDVDDPGSELHDRHDVGPATYRPGYHSIDTGKLTVAPLFAAQLAERIGRA